jgi:uncharacterized alkaline shock family protein YloU
MPERRVPGRSAVTRRAITDIVRSAVLGSYGVAGFASPRPIDHLIRWLRLDEPAIRIRRDESLRVAIHVRVAYGLPIAEVTRQVESAVRFAVGRALGRPIDALTIHVDGLDDAAGSGPPAGTDDPGRWPGVAIDAAPLTPEPVPIVPPVNGRGPNGRARDGARPADGTRAGGTQAGRTPVARRPVAPSGDPS